ncbi:unnamed protein product, partial [Larinioides sclopetarius]
MKCLLIGDSMIKYLKEHLSDNSFDFDLDIISYPGATIESLARKFSALKSCYDWVLVHVGTNNASLDSVEVILQKYRSLANTILLYNPDASIIFSSIVPRGFNLFQEDYRKTAFHLKDLNKKIVEINDALKKLCFDQEAFFFCSCSNTSWDGYLGRDGLHPNKRGNALLASCFRRSFKSCISTGKKISLNCVGGAFHLDSSEFPALPSVSSSNGRSALSEPALVMPASGLKQDQHKPTVQISHSTAFSARPVPGPPQVVLGQFIYKTAMPGFHCKQDLARPAFPQKQKLTRATLPFSVPQSAPPPLSVRQSAPPPLSVRQSAPPPLSVRQSAPPPLSVRQSA